MNEAKYDAVVFDLLTALIDSWSLWNELAGSAEQGLVWRKAYLRLTYQCGAYRPYEDLVHEAATRTGTDPACASGLLARWGTLNPWDDANDVLDAVGARVPLGIVTNTSEKLGRMAAGRLDATFAAIATAETVGFYKPRPEPYRAVLDMLGTDPRRTLFVAGSPADVPGAAGVGMPVMWHNRAGLPNAPGGVQPILVSDRLGPLVQLVNG